MKKIIISALLMGIMANGAVNVYAMTGENNNGIAAVSVIENATTNVKTFDELLTALKNKEIKVINLDNNITIGENDLDKLTKINGKNELYVNSGVTINGNNKTIDFTKSATLTIKGDDITLSKLTIKNGQDLGIQVYNSRNVNLKEVTVENAKRYGIFVNGSTVTLDDCITKSNGEGGILVSRSRFLRSDNCIDSEVKVVNKITHENEKMNVSIKNLEMPDTGVMQKNTFIMPDGKFKDTYKQVTIKFQNRKLSNFYFNLLGLEDKNKEYEEEIVTF